MTIFIKKYLHTLNIVKYYNKVVLYVIRSKKYSECIV